MCENKLILRDGFQLEHSPPPNKRTQLYKYMAKKKTAKKKTASGSKRGTRYTPAMKKKVIDFVNKVNAEKGRGGAAAASRKFDVGQLTIGKWVKGAGTVAPKKRGGRRKAAPARSTGESEFRILAEMDEEIATKRAELETLEAQFEQLKGKLLK